MMNDKKDRTIFSSELMKCLVEVKKELENCSVELEKLQQETKELKKNINKKN